MKKLTFEKQGILGIAGLGLGHLLWYMTGNGLFVNLGWIFNGIFFCFSPGVSGEFRKYGSGQETGSACGCADYFDGIHDSKR